MKCLLFKTIFITFLLCCFHIQTFSQKEEPKNGNGTGIDFLISKNNLSIDFSVLAYVSNNYRLKASIGVNILSSDRYNNDTSNRSILSIMNVGALLGVSLLKAAVHEIDGNNHKWKKFVMYPIIVPAVISTLLINSQHNFTILKTDTIVKNPLNLSIYAKSKLEYYDFQNINWFQYKPAVGIEVYKLFTKINFGVAISTGYEKPIDYIHKSFINRDLRPFGNIMLIYLMN
jgi:hypothetical protein